ncbi:MAG: hypothetical protein JWM53_4096 [bacterium]|nr:hypothetical protein [bacterium]
MPFTVTQRKRGGFEYTSVAETESAALVLATMMRRAGDEYCHEAAVTVCNCAGAVVAAWRGGNYGWTPVPQARPVAQEAGLQPLAPRAQAGTPPTAAKRRSGPFARMPTEPMASGSQVSIAHQSYASISITDYSAVSIA